MRPVSRTCSRAVVSSALALLASLVLCLDGKQPEALAQSSPARLGFSPDSPVVPAFPEPVPPRVVAPQAEPQPGTDELPQPRVLAANLPDAWPDADTRLLPINLGTSPAPGDDQ
jgi:hypothetical protein